MSCLYLNMSTGLPLHDGFGGDIQAVFGQKVLSFTVVVRYVYGHGGFF